MTLFNICGIIAPRLSLVTWSSHQLMPPSNVLVSAHTLVSFSVSLYDVAPHQQLVQLFLHLHMLFVLNTWLTLARWNFMPCTIVLCLAHQYATKRNSTMLLASCKANKAKSSPWSTSPRQTTPTDHGLITSMDSSLPNALFFSNGSIIWDFIEKNFCNWLSYGKRPTLDLALPCPFV